jgi:hypothetical protein
MPMDCVSVDTSLFQLQNNYFDNKYFWKWSNDAVDIIFTTFHVKALNRK